MKNVNITKAEAVNLLSKADSTFMGITNLSAKGKEQVFCARMGVKKHLRGGKSTTAHCLHLVTVYCMTRKGYRSVNLNTLVGIRAKGVNYKIVE